MNQDPQFGAAAPGRAHRDRPAAFGLVTADGRLALVQVTYPEKPPFFDLPGGAIDPGEDAAQALIREFGEETGLIVRPGRMLGRASQLFLTKGEEPVNNRCSFFEAVRTGADARLKIEEDHELVWMDPIEALTRLRHDAHAWAVAAWLRRGVREQPLPPQGR